MDEEIERLLVSVRADTGAFARDVADMRAQLDGPLADGIARAGHVLARAIQTGKFGFEDLKRTALAVMSEIAVAAVRERYRACGGSGRTASCFGVRAATSRARPAFACISAARNRRWTR